MISDKIFEEIGISRLDAYVINYAIGSNAMEESEARELLTVQMQERMTNNFVRYKTHSQNSDTSIFSDWKQRAAIDIGHYLDLVAQNSVAPDTQPYNRHLNTLTNTRKLLRIPE